MFQILGRKVSSLLQSLSHRPSKGRIVSAIVAKSRSLGHGPSNRRKIRHREEIKVPRCVDVAAGVVAAAGLDLCVVAAVLDLCVVATVLGLVGVDLLGLVVGGVGTPD